MPMTESLEQSQRPSAAPNRNRGSLILAGTVGLVLGIAIGGGAVALIGGSGDQRTATPAVTAAAAAITSTAAPVPTTAAPSPTGSSMHKLGEEVTEPDGAVKVTAFAYKQPVAQDAPRPAQPGYEWAAGDIQVCALVDNIAVNTIPWHLVYPDHTTISSSSTGYRQFPEPSYPWGDKDLPKGRCVRGWITFPAPADKRPVSIEHNPSRALTEWAIS